VLGRIRRRKKKKAAHRSPASTNEGNPPYVMGRRGPELARDRRRRRALLFTPRGEGEDGWGRESTLAAIEKGARAPPVAREGKEKTVCDEEERARHRPRPEEEKDHCLIHTSRGGGANLPPCKGKNENAKGLNMTARQRERGERFILTRTREGVETGETLSASFISAGGG